MAPNLATPDEFGEPRSNQWTVVRNCFAAIERVGMSEDSLPSLLVSKVTHILTLRWTPVTIDSSMQAVFRNHTFQIQAVENVEQRNVKLRLLALEINPTS